MMRYLAATTLLSLFGFTAVARAGHDVHDLSVAYHDAIHELSVNIDHDRYASRYTKSYVARLDRAANAFHDVIAHDPNCHRIEAMFDEMHSLHRRVERLIVGSCRTDQHLRTIWYEATHFIEDLDFAVHSVHRSHRHPVIQRRITVSRPVVTAPVVRQPIVVDPRTEFNANLNFSNRSSVFVNPPRHTSNLQRSDSHRYQLDQQRSRQYSVNNRNLNNRNLKHTNSSTDVFGRLLSDLLR